jgi:hypothetical protein
MLLLRCVTSARRDAATACNRSSDVALCYDQCYVRLSNQDFLDLTSNSGEVLLFNEIYITSTDRRPGLPAGGHRPSRRHGAVCGGQVLQDVRHGATGRARPSLLGGAVRGGPVEAAVPKLPTKPTGQVADHVPRERGAGLEDGCWSAVHLEVRIKTVLHWQRDGPVADQGTRTGASTDGCYERSVGYQPQEHSTPFCVCVCVGGWVGGEGGEYSTTLALNKPFRKYKASKKE